MNRKENSIYRSWAEFEKKFYPESVEKRRTEKPTDAHALGISLAKDSLEKIRARLAE